MSATRVLIVYGSHYGQTARIAWRIADLLTAAGDAVTLASADALPEGLTPRAFDGVVVGSPIVHGHHLRAVRLFVTAHADALNATPSAFFSVSGAAASPFAAERERARACVDAFLRTARWTPTRAETFGGALAYTRYGPVLRWIAHRGAEMLGGPTDTTRDHEFTDWTQVERFAESFAADVARPAAERDVVPA